MTPEETHLGTPIDIRTLIPISGNRRHPDDTEHVIVLTLYGQDGELNTLHVPRTRDNEMFQEWLRRFDRYTTAGEEDDRPE